jgi:5-methylcytosine-specific restriction endonuclease McrA
MIRSALNSSFISSLQGNDYMGCRVAKFSVRIPKFKLSLRVLSEDQLEELLKASRAFENLLTKYKQQMDLYERENNIFFKEANPLSSELIKLESRYKDLYTELIKFQTGSISYYWNSGIKYFLRPNLSGKGAGKELKLKAEARQILTEMEMLKKGYYCLEDEIKNLASKIITEKPLFPPSSHCISYFRKSYYVDLKEYPPHRIQKAIQLMHENQIYRAKASAYDEKQRQEANLIKQKIKKQINLFPNCPYCGKALDINDAHADHIYPISKGGLSTVKNMVFICSHCNLSKADLTLRNFVKKMRLNADIIYANLEELHKDF